MLKNKKIDDIQAFNLKSLLCGNRIYADCIQKLFSSGHDTSGKILLANFLAEQKRVLRAEIIIFGVVCIYFLSFFISNSIFGVSVRVA